MNPISFFFFVLNMVICLQRFFLPFCLKRCNLQHAATQTRDLCRPIYLLIHPMLPVKAVFAHISAVVFFSSRQFTFLLTPRKPAVSEVMALCGNRISAIKTTFLYKIGGFIFLTLGNLFHSLLYLSL